MSPISTITTGKYRNGKNNAKAGCLTHIHKSNGKENFIFLPRNSLYFSVTFSQENCSMKESGAFAHTDTADIPEPLIDVHALSSINRRKAQQQYLTFKGIIGIQHIFNYGNHESIKRLSLFNL